VSNEINNFISDYSEHKMCTDQYTKEISKFRTKVMGTD